MMAKVRVYQLAKELKVQSALILELLDRIGQDVKSDLSTLDAGVADLVRAKVTSALETEKKRLAEEVEHQKLVEDETDEQVAEVEVPVAAAEQEPEPGEAPVAPPVPVAARPPQAPPGAGSVAHGAREILRVADPVNGGFGAAPKFPTPTNL